MVKVDISQATVVIYTWGKSVPVPDRPIARFTIDVGEFRDPIGNKYFTSHYLNGRHPEVIRWVEGDDRVKVLAEEAVSVAEQYKKSSTAPLFLTFGLWDYHGRWIAPAVAESMAEALDKAGFKVAVVHRVAKEDPSVVKG